MVARASPDQHEIPKLDGCTRFCSARDNRRTMHNRLAAAGQMCSAHHRLCVPPKSRVFRFLLCDSTTKLAWLPHSLRLPKYHLLSKHEFVSKSPGGETGLARLERKGGKGTLTLAFRVHATEAYSVGPPGHERQRYTAKTRKSNSKYLRLGRFEVLYNARTLQCS